MVARGNILKALFDGAMFLDYGLGYRPEPLREVWDLANERRLGKPDPTPGIKPFSTAKCAQPLNELEASRVLNGFAEGALYTARTDHAVFGMLLTLGRDGVDWRTLYALTDTMTANGMDTAKQWKAAGSSEKAFKLFKHTANSFSVLGPDARHGQTRHQPPANPMTLDEAAKIVLAAANTFVNARIGRATATLAGAVAQTRRTVRPTVPPPPSATAPIPLTAATDHADEGRTHSVVGADIDAGRPGLRALALASLVAIGGAITVIALGRRGKR